MTTTNAEQARSAVRIAWSKSSHARQRRRVEEHVVGAELDRHPLMQPRRCEFIEPSTAVVDEDRVLQP